jgi:hypothetical protein
LDYSISLPLRPDPTRLVYTHGPVSGMKVITTTLRPERPSRQHLPKANG